MILKSFYQTYDDKPDAQVSVNEVRKAAGKLENYLESNFKKLNSKFYLVEDDSDKTLVNFDFNTLYPSNSFRVSVIGESERVETIYPKLKGFVFDSFYDYTPKTMKEKELTLEKLIESIFHNMIKNLEEKAVNKLN